MELECTVQKYEWGKIGSDSLVARLKKGGSASTFEIESNKPYAELWMGTHPNGPSIISSSGEKLEDWITAHPESLGSVVREQFGDELSFLFKVLSVNKALSIQAHPNKELAEQLHKKFPDVYKDPNHKPELAVALTKYETLCGFRPIQEIKDYIQRIPELRNVIGEADSQDLIQCNDNDEVAVKQALKKSFHSLMTCAKDKVESELNDLLKRHETLDEASRDSENAALVKRLAKAYPGDVGCFSVYFMNEVTLEPGEALYLGANEPHAYLYGDCIECMACSDNVVRAGLTPKFIDVETLCSMLTYNCQPARDKRLVPLKENDFTTVFRPPVQDFAVAKIDVGPSSEEFTLTPRASASIVIVVEGNAVSTTSVPLQAGKAIFLAAEETLSVDTSTLSSRLLLFQAFTNLP